MHPVELFKRLPKVFSEHQTQETINLIYKRESVEKLRKIKPTTSGAYIFFSKEGDVLYVGKSSCVKNRVLDHLKYATNTSMFIDFVHYIGLILIPKHERTYVSSSAIEHWLIQALKPIFNGTANEEPRYKMALSDDLILFNPSVRHGVIRKLIIHYRQVQGINKEEVTIYSNDVSDEEFVYKEILAKYFNSPGEKTPVA
jgi:hypothetical protein